MDRTILHCDCNGFFASVECVLDPKLKNVPMAVGGDESSRHGIILAKNELAKKFNIQTAETIYSARKKCPDLVIVPPRHDEYAKYSEYVNSIYAEYTDMVERFGIDESWLDVTGSYRLFGDGKTIADTLRRRVREEIGLTISVGVSFNKVFAKLGSDYKKPDATTVISRENYQEIVYPLPADALLFVGRKSSEILKSLHINTIGDLACADEKLLLKRLGKAGEMLSKYARGEDDDPVRKIGEEDEVKSVGNGMTFRRDLVGEEDIRVGLSFLSDTVAARMRRIDARGQTVTVTIKSPDFRVITRQAQLKKPSHLANDIYEMAFSIVKNTWNFSSPIRMLTVTVSSLTHLGDAQQLSLFSDAETDEREETLEKALDEVRKKFGKNALKKGRLLDNDLGIK